MVGIEVGYEQLHMLGKDWTNQGQSEPVCWLCASGAAPGTKINQLDFRLTFFRLAMRSTASTCLDAQFRNQSSFTPRRPSDMEREKNDH